MKATTHRELVRRHLLTGSALTPKESRQRWGCDRLAARIGELRAEGMDIVDMRSQCKTRYSVYRLRTIDGQGVLMPLPERGRPE